jgi:hypothetical protein
LAVPSSSHAYHPHRFKTTCIVFQSHKANNRTIGVKPCITG